MSFRFRVPSTTTRYGQAEGAGFSTNRGSTRSAGLESSPHGRLNRPSILRPFFAGVVSTVVVLYTTRARIAPLVPAAGRSASGRANWTEASRGALKEHYRDDTVAPADGDTEAGHGEKGGVRGWPSPDRLATAARFPTEVGRASPSGMEVMAKKYFISQQEQQEQQQKQPGGQGQGRGQGAENAAPSSTSPASYFSEDVLKVVVNAVERYAGLARSILEADDLAVRQGHPLQGKYIVLASGNELANRLRGVLSGFFLGILTDRVFVADITYQKDVTEGLLSALFEGPGYEWDLSKLSPQLRRALGQNVSKGSTGKLRRGGGGASGTGATLNFDMSKDYFQRWVCDDVVDASGAQVVTLSTVVYPLPLLVRNPAYSGHPILQAAIAATATVGEGGPQSRGAGGGQEDRLLQPGSSAGVVIGQRGVEALETILTRIILRPARELRERAADLGKRVREEAERWRWRGRGERRGNANGREPPAVRIVGIHARTYFMKAVSSGTLERNLQHLEDCAVAGGGGSQAADDTFLFVATDELDTQKTARKVWGDRCYFAPFGLPGSKLEGIKAAFVDLLVMGSFDDFVITPHSSFSELGATLSYTWFPDSQVALRALPNRPIVPVFPDMNGFERRKIFSLLDRRATEIVPPAGGVAGGTGGGEGMCMRAHAAGMSVTVAKGRELLSMFEAIEDAPCMRERRASVAVL